MSKTNVFSINELIGKKTNSEIMVGVGQRFANRRKECGYSQEKLSKKSGVGLATIKRFETTGEITFSNLIKLSSAIDSSNEIDNLFTQKKITSLF